MSHAPAKVAGRIGPNAILQLLAALDRQEGEGASLRLLATAGIVDPRGAADPPMVPVESVRAAHGALLEIAGPDRARHLIEEAGRRTAHYLLLNRIPASLQRLLRLLPRGLARRLLLRAIARHAWTFTGGSRLAVTVAPELRIAIDPCPLCLSPRGPDHGGPGLGCSYYAATFETLVRCLVDPRARIEPAACGTAGSRVCLLVGSSATG